MQIIPEILVFLAFVLVAAAILWVKLANPIGRADENRLKKESERLLAKMDKNVAERRIKASTR